MQALLNQPFQIGDLQLPNRLIQGPLAGFSCAPFRALFYAFYPPSYCVSEMISAHDVLYKHNPDSRYLYRAPSEKKLCYQLVGNDPVIIAQAAKRLEELGADLIDLNCGCPKPKIRKKGAGSALLETPEVIGSIVSAVREAIKIPLTVKIRLNEAGNDIILAKAIEEAGADALIVHGRYWTQAYDSPCNIYQIGQIKRAIQIPVIANGDIRDKQTLRTIIEETGCDAYMIARAGTGRPWLYQHLLLGASDQPEKDHQLLVSQFMTHLAGLSELEDEHQAVLQSRTLVRYYFKKILTEEHLPCFYALKSLHDIEKYMRTFASS